MFSWHFRDAVMCFYCLWSSLPVVPTHLPWEGPPLLDILWYKIVCQGEAEPRGWARTKVLLHRAKEAPSATFPDFHTNVATGTCPTLGAVWDLWFLSVSQWPQGHILGDFRFAVAGEWDQQSSCKAGSLRNGTELSLRLAGVCSGQHHSIIIFPISFHRWFGAAINGMCFLNITIIICVLFTSDKTPAETHKKLVWGSRSFAGNVTKASAGKWEKLKTWLLFLQRTPSWTHKFLFNAQWQL